MYESPTSRPNIPARPHDTVSGSRLQIADVETLDKPVSHSEDVHHQSVGQEISLGVVHSLMNFDNQFPLAVWRDLDGLDMRIDDRPFTFPIARTSSRPWTWPPSIPFA